MSVRASYRQSISPNWRQYPAGLILETCAQLGYEFVAIDDHEGRRLGWSCDRRRAGLKGEISQKKEEEYEVTKE